MNRPRLSVPVLGLASALGLAACSLLVERGADQCATDADCAALGPAFAGRVCSAERVCVASRPVDEGGTTEAGGTDAQPARACTTNAECIDAAGGQPAVCRKDTFTCATLLNADCDAVTSSTPTGEALSGVAAVRDDDTVLLGSLLSLRGSNAAKNRARVQAAELAIAEVMNRAAGLPPLRGTTKRRPVALLSCNDTDDANPPPAVPAATRSAEHLLAVGVPAVIGAGNSGLTISVNPLLPKRGVLLVSPSATSPAITSLDDDGLLWRTAPSDALQAIPLASRIQALAPEASSRKVAILYKSDAYGQGLFGTVVAGVRRQGKALSDPANAAVAFLRQYDPSAADQSQLIAALYAFQPDVIAIMGTNEGVTSLLAPIEAGWVGGTSNAPRPVYVVSDGLKSSALTAAVSADEAQTSTGLRGRVSGTAPGRPTATTTAFLLRFEPRYGAENSKTFGTASAYDAAYVLLYGIAAQADGPPTGRSIADGIRKIVGGASAVDVGPDGVSEVFQKLGAGATVDLRGASSPLDFDEAGESPADIEVWCIAPNVPTPTFVTTDLYYDAAARSMRGAYGCP